MADVIVSKVHQDVKNQQKSYEIYKNTYKIDGFKKNEVDPLKIDDENKENLEFSNQNQHGGHYDRKDVKISLWVKNHEEHRCLECNLTGNCKFLVSDGGSKFLCSDKCLLAYSSKNGFDAKFLDVCQDKSEMSSKTLIRKCVECFRALVDPRFNFDSICWEYMEFCDEECIEQYQARNCSICHICKSDIPKHIFGKFSVKIGHQFKHFCSIKCLNRCKMQFSLCFFCYENTDKFVTGNFGGKLFKFCSRACLEKYEQLSKPKAQNFQTGLCTSCRKLTKLYITFENSEMIFKFCTRACFDSYKHQNGVDPLKCSNCKNFFNDHDTRYSIYFDKSYRHFCSSICKNLFIGQNKVIIQCSWCKSLKYDYDMIKKNINQKMVHTCTLRCLRLYQKTLAIFEKNKRECELCQSDLNNRFHVTMWDNSMYSFCSRTCVDNYLKRLQEQDIVQKRLTSNRLTTYQNIAPKSTATSSNAPQIQTQGTQCSMGSLIPVQIVNNLSQTLHTSANPPPSQSQGIQCSMGSSGNLIPLLSALNPNSEVPKALPLVQAQFTQVPSLGNLSQINLQITNPPLNQFQGTQCSIGSSSNIIPLPTLLNPNPETPKALPPVQAQFTPVPSLGSLSQTNLLLLNPNPEPPMTLQSSINPAQSTQCSMGSIKTLIPTSSLQSLSQTNLLLLNPPENPLTAPKPSPPPKYQRHLLTKPRTHPKMVNKMTHCRPFQSDKSQSTDYILEHKEAQTDFSNVLIPIPFPIYVPMPLLVPRSVPVPVPVPIPIPVPIFLPMKQGSSQGIMKEINRIKETFPNDPLEAEMIQMAHSLQEDHDSSDLEWEDVPLDQRIEKEKGRVKILKVERVVSLKRDDLERDITKSSIAKEKGRCSKRKKVDVQEPASLNVAYGTNAWYFWFHEKYNGTSTLKKTILDLTSEELSRGLSEFVVEIRKPSGQEYFPDTIFYLCLCLQKYLTLNGKMDNIFVDDFYQGFIKTFDLVSSRFATLHQDSKFVTTRVEEQYLWEARQLGTFSPKTLIHTLIYLNTINFKLTTVSDHLQLSFGRLVKNFRNDFSLRYYPPSKTCPDKKKRYLEVFENRDDFSRCAVRIFDIYISKCPDHVKRSNICFYLMPEKHCVQESPIWFSNQPMEEEELGIVLRRFKMIKEVNMI